MGFLLYMAAARSAGEISDAEWGVFLRGAAAVNLGGGFAPPNPHPGICVLLVIT